MGIDMGEAGEGDEAIPESPKKKHVFRRLPEGSTPSSPRTHGSFVLSGAGMSFLRRQIGQKDGRGIGSRFIAPVRRDKARS
jgi:hypothetical protein